VCAKRLKNSYFTELTAFPQKHCTAFLLACLREI